MKVTEAQPMPRSTLRVRLILLVLFFLLVVLLAWNWKSLVGSWVAIVASLALTLFIVSLTDLLPEALRQLAERGRSGKFRRFFGEAAFESEVKLVFAHRVLDSIKYPDPWILHFNPPLRQGKRPVAEGVNAWLAHQDLRCAAYLANEVRTMTGREVKFIHDKDTEAGTQGSCAISIGLGFNGYTHHLAHLCGDRLFKIEWDESPKDRQLVTDTFSVDGKKPTPSVGEDECIVARIVPPDRPKHILFVCAGRTAPGTAAAGYYLARRWVDLMAQYREEKKSLDLDSMVAVISHDAPVGGSEMDKSGRMRRWKFERANNVE